MSFGLGVLHLQVIRSLKVNCDENQSTADRGKSRKMLVMTLLRLKMQTASQSTYPYTFAARKSTS
mgnify:CR=1 FL=1